MNAESAIVFFHLAVACFLALIPPVNPLGTAVIVGPLLGTLSSAERRIAARKIAVYCFLICATTVVIGSWIFRLFGISLPVVQIAGGILICRMGWQLLTQNKPAKSSNESSQPESDLSRVDDILFYPLAFPMTTGAGTISVLLTLSARSHHGGYLAYFNDLSALLIAIALMSVVIFLSYAFTPTLVRRLGNRGEQIVNQLSAFLVFCVGIQIASEGIVELIH